MSGMSEGNASGIGRDFRSPVRVSDSRSAARRWRNLLPLPGTRRGQGERTRSRASAGSSTCSLTRGQLSIVDVALELGRTREQIESDLYDLVGLGLFTGYVDWRKGVLHSVEAAQLETRTTCPNCGGELVLAGKGLIKCPYCGAEIFLGPEGARELEPVGADAISAGGSTR